MVENVIAIDGPAASGKSTAAAILAQKLGITYVNTGNMFRAVTLAAIRNGIACATDCTDDRLAGIIKNLQLSYAPDKNGQFVLMLDGQVAGDEIRSPEVAKLVSPVATLPSVRSFLKNIQRQIAGERMVVMEGRDIGTAVFPNAKFKFFITASPEERARRRLTQSGENLSGTTLEEVAAAIAERDRIDSGRAIAPLKAAPDAIKIDNSHMSIDQVVEFIVKRVTNEA